MQFALGVLLLCGGISGSWAASIQKGPRCPAGWTKLDTRCFIFQNESLNFRLAETVCNILGGNLVSIHSQLENEVVRHMILAGAGSFARTWIGLYDRIVDGDYLWTDGSAVDFFDWAPGRPTMNNNQDCVEINFPNNDQWNDRGCGRRQPFVCAKDQNHF
ncbi:ladderlectin-like isoform X1 [Syngnathus acus]|uniref:ladderlectin-like isoform X1 n=1 Tax=Syngnathus acus TaxID=161584 RepID=UPI001885B11A|nr:ladderlectin-like isoform X1 [Syngnathus acus]XP_037126885.1 ladderlectin-like isoform X1 [Syngnathus acus]XP_037126886.1 ladderlectin-like isoform X1 [Syngnathus acus]XP_037126890.1 ladderlectin-like isoform X1 [Syngnathus acus]XP_037126891.1 ladderlectin-like isoform X1 [Syngnathus acus]XP_037126892.1 ladderlectin-like isoform X1 [Syngnathus acus]